MVAGVIVFYVIPLLAVAEVVRCLVLEHRSDRIPILLYHRFIRKADARCGRVADTEMIWVCYDTEFAAQMDYLNDNGWVTLTLDDYCDIRAGRREKPAKCVLITMDDGYDSNYRLAYPVLRARNQRATIFVALEPDDHTRRQVEGVDDFVTEAQMREMSVHGIDIQSHTLTHCILTELDDDQAGYELSESRKRLTAITQKTVDHIAIPRAGYSRRIKRLVARAGYRSACCNNKGSSNGWSDPLALPRIVIERDMSVDDFAAALTPAHAAVLRLVGNVKRIPERFGGAVFARTVRNLLYHRWSGWLFRTRSLKRVLGVCALGYAVGVAWFTWYLLAR